MRVNIESLTIDQRLQNRSRMNDEAVQDYAEKMKAGEKFPPVLAVQDGETLWLTEGFHRVEAYGLAGITSIDVETREGTFRTAWLHSRGANRDHGVRMTNECKRHNVAEVLDDPECSTWTSREIAELCGVTHWLVNKMRDEREPKSLEAASKSKATSQESPKKEAKNSPASQTPETTMPVAEAQPATAGEPSSTPASEPTVNLGAGAQPEPAGVEPEDDGLDDEETAEATAAAQAEDEALELKAKQAQTRLALILLDDEDPLNRLAKENLQLSAEVATLRSRLTGEVAKNNELAKLIEYWKRKAGKK